MPLFQPPTLLQTVFSEVQRSTTTTSTSFVLVNDLVTYITIQQGSVVEVHFTVSASASVAASMKFQLLIDDVAQTAVHLNTIDTTGAQSAAIRWRAAGLSAGLHTFAIKWLTSAGTARIRPFTSNVEHGALLLKELTV